MDSERYGRIRELFLAVEELPQEQQLEFLASRAGGDDDLVAEVLSLLREHDDDFARREGDSAKKPAIPSVAARDTDPPGATSGSTPVNAPYLPSQPSGERSAAAGKLQKRREKKPSSSKRSDTPSAQVTQHGSQRTHASPRYADEPRPRRRPASAGLLSQRASRQRRLNSGWLWLAAVLPTALIGWLTYRQVEADLRASAAGELVGTAESLGATVDRFLSAKARLVESWSDREGLREAAAGLVAVARNESPKESLRRSPHAKAIREHLVSSSRREDIKYVVWDRTGTIIASWLPDGADIGGSVAPDGAGNLARAMRGETVLFGPEVLQEDGSGFQPETRLPVMAEIIPIRDADDKIIATMLVRGMSIFEDFDRMFAETSEHHGLDAYAVNRSGMMISNSPTGRSALGDQVESLACRIRLSDPGASPNEDSLLPTARRRQPLCYSAVGVSSGRSGERFVEYRNYLGQRVIGAWRWLDAWEMGVVVERPASSVFASARFVAFGFIGLGSVLSLTAFLAAARIARRTAMAHAEVHPLSRYEILNELGSGGMGVVYRAKHNQLGRDTALKVLRSDRPNTEDRLRFDREARLAASLGSPHTVTIYDYGVSEEGEAYCVMEFLQGITLYDVVARSGFQSYGRALYILRQICDSLGEAHKLGLVHRDVKPQNVMLSHDPSVGDWAVVFDFGLAKPLEPDAGAYQTAETIWAGTPMYMAPERYREPNKIDPRSDIYSIGCILYFLLSGRPPFIECDPESLFALVLAEQPISIHVHRDEDVPEDIECLVQRCMAKSLDDRYRSVEQLAADLDRLTSKYAWSIEQSRSWWRIHGNEID
ncbi:MAG: protein kinase [Planctomycetota bacterium]